MVSAPVVGLTHLLRWKGGTVDWMLIQHPEVVSQIWERFSRAQVIVRSVVLVMG